MRNEKLQRARRGRRSAVLGALVALSAAAPGCAAELEERESVTPTLRAETADAESASLWAPGECDAIYEFRAHSPEDPEAPYVVPVGGEYHPQIAIDPPWGDEKVHVVAWKPLTDNKKVVHHWILWEGQQNLLGWAPGSPGSPVPSKIGIEMPTAKSSLRLDMHYYNLTGTKEELDRSGVALCTVKGANLRDTVSAVHGGFAVFSPVMVPANARGHELKGSCTVKAAEPITVMSVSPHAHTRARHMRFAVTKPDGREIVVHEGSFSFFEQVGHPLDPPLVLEDGDQVSYTCTYDNDSNRNIGWGESTEDEMCFHWAVYYPKGALNCGPTNLFRPIAAP